MDIFFILSDPGYYCGTGIGGDQEAENANTDDGTDDGTGVISDGPFILTFHADEIPGFVPDPTTNPNTPTSMAQNELGFSLDYRISTSCPDLNFGNAA